MKTPPLRPTKSHRHNTSTADALHHLATTSSSTPTSLTELFKPLANVFEDAAKQISLAMHCRMRRFYLERHAEEVWSGSGTGIIAEGVVFEDGTVALRWKTQHASTGLYASVDDLMAIHSHGGKTVLHYIDGEAIPQ